MSTQLQNKLINHCSQALCGIKASNLVNICFNEVDDVLDEIEELNRKYNPKIYFVILKITKTNVLVLIYRTKAMERVLLNEDCLNYLYEAGYPRTKDIKILEKHLIERMNEGNDFPHEIGVFLGYDLDDIKAFSNNEKKCLFVGYWKVYSNLEEKLKLFNSYNTCREKLTMLVNKGYSLENFMR